ncbi:hypothetical protein [Paractinoplanes durhamensis]|uniref:DUF5666 domain-containing protein n=1 Tax=Paractinoplanes durhamensis TaxID=113563 RepID=A0ABQ3Z9V8_9ACTN|nr:hypothetical protein [Actinoplanes durhamensis]GIE06609.1 hypothetical protein Adu01nite_79590 [Actinoplanes durhamensis]
MRRTLVALGISGALLLAGCGVGAGAAASSDVADEAVALQQVGFETGLDDTASAGTGDAPRKALRQQLRRNTLHGEVVIATKKNGNKTVVVQRGTVTAVTATGVSVKSSDGFALTWTFGDKLRIVQNRKKVEASALTTGAEIGLAGTKDGDVTSARLIAIK